MSIQIARHSFDGPYSSPAYLEDRAGVYVVMDKRRDGKSHLLDVGESAAVRTRLQSHEREDCWERNRQGTIQYAVLHTPGTDERGRQRIEQEIRDQYAPTCGVR